MSTAGFHRAIHLLYVPTLYCNLDCSYCYLGAQTGDAPLAADAARAVATLEHTLAALEAAGVLAFNVSLHGGEVSTLPPAVLDALFTLIRGHYLRHFDAINALGQRKASPHIKTNLYRFAPLYELFERHKVSISASIDLPLALHERHRTRRDGSGWRQRTEDNLRLLGRYPHAKKISATLSAEHLADIPALIADIRYIHDELGFDMNQMNLMFAFPSGLNASDPRKTPLSPASAEQQLALYAALHAAFGASDLAEGLHRHWFDEFKPSYCTNAFNCGEKFYLLQSDGNVYSCVRGQGIPEFHYGNVFTDPVEQILATGARKIAAIHQQFGLDAHCGGCSHLSLCHTGCPVVKFQTGSGRSYTCGLQKTLYRDYPRSFPADDEASRAAYARDYTLAMHPALAVAAPPPLPALQLPQELAEDRNALQALIAADPLLQQLYSAEVFRLEVGDELLPLESQLLKRRRDILVLGPGERLRLHVRRELFEAACDEPIRNTLYLQLLRDTPVVYGDEKRRKQEHLFTYQLFRNLLAPSGRCGADWLEADLGGLLALHQPLFLRGVANNLFVTTQYLRDYHYRKQKDNAFYHIQALNLPFQNVEFHYLPHDLPAEAPDHGS